VLTDLLDGQELPTGEVDEAGKEITQTLPPSAAIITSAIQFLKNNNITCVASEDNALGALRQKQEEREARRKANKLDLNAATEATSFLSGLSH
jgi:hypothetical protein